jgi:hypothetical protein
LKTYRVGELKDCAVTVTNILDSTDFSITSATYSHHSGSTVFTTGVANTDGKIVFVALQPTVISSNSVVTFTIVCQPMANGVPDNSKTTETVMFDVQVKVTK